MVVEFIMLKFLREKDIFYEYKFKKTEDITDLRKKLKEQEPHDPKLDV